MKSEQKGARNSARDSEDPDAPAARKRLMSPYVTSLFPDAARNSIRSGCLYRCARVIVVAGSTMTRIRPNPSRRDAGCSMDFYPTFPLRRERKGNKVSYQNIRDELRQRMRQQLISRRSEKVGRLLHFTSYSRHSWWKKHYMDDVTDDQADGRTDGRTYKRIAHAHTLARVMFSHCQASASARKLQVTRPRT